MAISRKPQRSASSSVDVDALINRGGSPSPDAESREKSATTPLLLRVPTDMLEQVESVLKARPVRLPRHTWILEAIHEKLSRESGPPAKL
jgi:hypothetical protein